MVPRGEAFNRSPVHPHRNGPFCTFLRFTPTRVGKPGVASRRLHRHPAPSVTGRLDGVGTASAFLAMSSRTAGSVNGTGSG